MKEEQVRLYSGRVVVHSVSLVAIAKFQPIAVRTVILVRSAQPGRTPVHNNVPCKVV